MPAAYVGQSLKATAAKTGTAQSLKRPVTLTGTGTVEKITLTEAQHAAFRALDADTFEHLTAIRRTFLDKIETRRVMDTGRIGVTPEGLAAFRADVEQDAARYGVHPRVLSSLILAAGVFVTAGSAEDTTDDVLDGLFGSAPDDDDDTADAAPAPDADAAPAKSAK